jgi:drug/metabolite transporter (DMT)-like permease
MKEAPRQALLLKAMPAVFVLIWSTGFIVARYGMPYSPPFKFLLVRYGLSVLCFLPWIVIARVRWPSGLIQWFHLMAAGILMHAGYLGGVWAAVKAGMGSGLAALIVGLQPVLTAIWLTSAARGGEKLTAAHWLGLLFGSLGLYFVVASKLGTSGVGDTVSRINLLFAITALVSITVGTLYQKRYVRPCDVRTANTVQLAAAFVATLPLAALESESILWTTELTAAMTWSVLGLTLGGSSLLYLLIQRGAASKVTSLMYLVPPTTAMIAWILFGEALTLGSLIGMGLTAVGVSLVLRSTGSASRQ